MNCIQCGAELQEGRVFCTRCGADNRAAAGVAAGVAAVPAAQSETTWFVHVNGNSVGPLTRDKVVAMINQGRVKPSTQVYDAGAAAWRKAVEIREFSQALSARRIGALAGAGTAPDSGAFVPQGTAYQPAAEQTAKPLNHAVSEVRRERQAADIKSRDVRILVLGTLLTLVALLLGTSAGARISKASKLPPELAESWPTIKERETTYDEVIAILGEPAESNYSAMEGTSFDSCTWNLDSENGTQYSVMIMFIDDQVTSKMIIPTSEIQKANQ